MSRAFLVHDHFVAMTRERLGERADVLLADAARRHEGSIWRLSEAMGVRLVMRTTDGGGTEADAYQKREGSRWHGDALHLDRFVPATAQTRMPGMRLGDVVVGTGADDRVIRHVDDGGRGTTITIETRRVDARAMRLPPLVAVAGPIRRMLRGMQYEWHQATTPDEDRARTLMHAAGDASFVAVMSMMVLLALTTITSHDVPATIAKLAMGSYAGWKAALVVRIMIRDHAVRRAAAEK